MNTLSRAAIVSATIMCAPFAALADMQIPCSFSSNALMRFGTTGADVLVLQRLLNRDADTAVALSGDGSVGFETSRFGALTRLAVIKFQNKYAADILIPNGLTKGTGLVGASTRAKMFALCTSPVAVVSAVPTAQPPVATTSAPAIARDALTVTDPGQTASSLAPSYAGVLFLSFKLTAGDKDVTVSGVTVERTGFGSDRAFANLALFDDVGLQVGNVASLDVNHRATFKKSFLLHARETRQYDVYGNMDDATDYVGQMPLIQLNSITASSPTEGAVPMRGTMHTLNSSLTVGGATGYVSSFDPRGNRTYYINDKNVIFSGIRMTANSQEDITLPYIIWSQSGTAAQSDIENVRTIVDGRAYPAVISPYSDREYISFFEPGIVIKKGDTIDAHVRADIKVTAGNRTIQFDIRDNTDDVGFTGNTYDLGVGLVPGGDTSVGDGSSFLTSDGTTHGTTLSTFYKGSTISVSGGGFISIGR